MFSEKILCLIILFVAFNSFAKEQEPAEDYSGIYLASRPSVSPDGSQFAFEWCNSIWIASTEGGKAWPVEMNPARDIWPVFSCDGKHIAFQSDRDGGRKIFDYNMDSREIRQVTCHSESSVPYGWKKNGEAIISVVYRDDPGACYYRRIASVPLQNGKSESVLFDTYGDEPSLSPDEKMLLFTREGEQLYRKGVYSTKASQIWCYNLETKEFSCMVRRMTEARTPLWDPSGKGFYYVGGQSGAMNVWHRDIASGEERQVTFYKDDSVIHPSLSRDGSTMVFRHLFDFYVIDPRKKAVNPHKIILHPAQQPIRPDHRRRFYDSCWNNDEDGDVSFCDFGMQVAFTTGGDLFVMDTKLCEPVCVHGSSLTHERSCVFSKDGSSLYYISDHGDGSALCKAECVETNKLWWENTEFTKSVLINDAKVRSELKVSPDGKMLSWIEPVGQLVIAGLDGTEIVRYKQGGGTSKYAWSPDSRWIVAGMSDDYGNSDIWILSVDKKSPPCNISRHFSWDGDPCWSSDGKLIAYVGLRDNNERKLFYLYVNEDDENFVRREKSIEDAHNAVLKERGIKNLEESSCGNGKSRDVVIDFDDIHTRVRTVELKNAEAVSSPFFSEANPSTLAFAATIKGDKGTWKIFIPGNLTPSKMTDRTGVSAQWIAKNDRLLWVSDRKPAHFTKTIPVSVYQDTLISDYQELGFLSAWGRLRDWFYDPDFHGADWNAIKEKYRMAARHAPNYSVYSRVLHLLNGELRASHLGFNSTDNSKKEWDIGLAHHAWEEETGHLGLLYSKDYRGRGWLISSVIPGGPADQTINRICPGDIVVSINNIPLDSDTDPASVLNRRSGLPVDVEIQSGTNLPYTVSIKPVSYKKVHELRNEQYYKELRDIVRKGSDNKFGYLHIAKMRWENYYKFEKEIFAEGFDKEGMIIDVRDNLGGFTADHIINILCGMNHSVSIMRDGQPAYLSGYWGRPVFDKPIVVLCNQHTASNGEIFTHAMKTLKRAKIVGVPTSGGVIATSDHSLLDFGTIRLPHRGWFLPDGRNMDFNSAVPDIVIWNTPEDEISGRDPQLEKAVEVLKADVDEQKKNSQPFKPKHSRIDPVLN